MCIQVSSKYFLILLYHFNRTLFFIFPIYISKFKPESMMDGDIKRMNGRPIYIGL